MYLAFFNMENLPFVRSVPVSALYDSPEVLEALARLGYTAEKQQFAVVSGDSETHAAMVLWRVAGPAWHGGPILPGRFEAPAPKGN